jgi:hypothetical protein
LGTVLAAVVIHLFEVGIDSFQGAGYQTANWLLLSAHWIRDQTWLLLITAFLPALVAALHGILSTLELQHADLYNKMESNMPEMQPEDILERPDMQELPQGTYSVHLRPFQAVRVGRCSSWM